jgi:hypothetical protein
MRTQKLNLLWISDEEDKRKRERMENFHISWKIRKKSRQEPPKVQKLMEKSSPRRLALLVTLMLDP